ncbi:MAG: elongation factor P maturation arginine rhamnosyltransferase EarP [Burkholderiales bacterium]|nr:elongation factor P maturation arginine rhamnosyltransferase EarP [Burkholderiales bacterium]
MPPTPALRWDVFCRVIDNHGDLGVCWRFATDLAGRGQQVRLWVDDGSALAWMAPQGCTGVQLRHWADAPGDAGEAELGDVVVEAFGCDPPAGFVARMAARATSSGVAPVWINLEYLSAEAYVERSHGLASPQFSGPGQGLVKWFWYPGFTQRTGGLLREPGLLARQSGFDATGARRAWLRRVDPHAGDDARLALLFCYDNPALPSWLDAMSRAERPWCVLVTPGLAMRGVKRWWQDRTAESHAPVDARGSTSPTPMRRGSLSLLPLAAVDQQRFDRLLWACDLNFVRGEDSFVRAHWAGRPFIWQAYVQDDGAHHTKIAAWLQMYAGAAPEPLRRALTAAHQAWNGTSTDNSSQPGEATLSDHAGLRDLFGSFGPGDSGWWSTWCTWAGQRSAELARQQDLVTQLLGFVAARRPAAAPR